MKWQSVGYTIGMYLAAIFIFIATPLYYLCAGRITLMAQGMVGHLAIVMIACLYFCHVTPSLVAGSLVMLDLITKSFVMKKMVFFSSYVNPHRVYGRHGRFLFEKDADFYVRMRRHRFVTVALADQGKTLIFTTEYRHTMEKGKSYNIRYGERSRTIISILSEEGEEMLMMGDRHYEEPDTRPEKSRPSPNRIHKRK